MRAAANDWMLDPAPHEAGQDALDRRALDLALRLAGFALAPSRHVHPERLSLSPFAPAEVAAMAAHHAFAGPVEATLSEALGLKDIAVGRMFLAKLSTSAPARAAVLLLTQPLAEAARLAGEIAAAVLSRRIVGLILKRDRDAARAALGEEAFGLAIHEVPLLNGPLADLDGHGGAGLPTAMLDPQAAVAFGRAVVRRFLDGEDPALAHLHDLTAALQGPAADPDHVRPFLAAQTDHFVRFVRRRQPAWSAIIS